MIHKYPNIGNRLLIDAYSHYCSTLAILQHYESVPTVVLGPISLVVSPSQQKSGQANRNPARPCFWIGSAIQTN